jgi:glycosyltransferase involved in cell wall biosynthesis
LAEGLVRLGHEVTLFATADSRTSGTLVATSQAGWSEDATVEPKVAECVHIAEVFERAAEFDIIHNSFDFLPLTYSRLVDTPVVTTIHGFSSPRIVPVYERYNDIGAYVAISDADRHPRLSYAATIHHGIDTDTFRISLAPRDYLLFFGRIHPEKGTAHAIEVARATGRPLVIAGIIQDEVYFRERIAPYVDEEWVRFVGPVGGDERLRLLADAHALLHLVEFDEPFGFSVVEALACGTPVIANQRGSMPEIIDHGATGFLVTEIAQAVDAVHRVGMLDRNAIRSSTVERFNVAVMVERYVGVYPAVLERGSAGVASR